MGMGNIEFPEKSCSPIKKNIKRWSEPGMGYFWDLKAYIPNPCIFKMKWKIPGFLSFLGIFLTSTIIFQSNGIFIPDCFLSNCIGIFCGMGNEPTLVSKKTENSRLKNLRSGIFVNFVLSYPPHTVKKLKIFEPSC